MGCGGSKVDNLPLVTICRERKDLIKSASDYRFALAAAHVSYFHSLTDVGDAIRKFVDEELVIASSASPGSPVLTLPSQEGKSKKNSPTSTSISHSLDSSHNSNKRGAKHKKREQEEEIEDSHLHLSTPSSGSDSGSGHIHFGDSPKVAEEEGGGGGGEVSSTSYDFGNYPNPNPYPHPYPYPYPYPDPYLNPYPNMYFMKKSAAPAKTVVYEDSSVNGYWDSGYFGNGGGYFGYPMMREQPSPQKTPQPPPEPPSPPSVSTWDYFNVFDVYDNNNGDGGGYPGYYPMRRHGYGSTSSSPDSKEVREREGIPDLEEETEHEVIKEEVHKNDNNKKQKMINEDEEMEKKKTKKKKDYGEGTSKTKSMPMPSSGSSESVESVVKGKGVFKSSTSPDTFMSPNSSLVSKSSPDDNDDDGEGYVKKKGVVSFEVEEGSPATMTTDVDSSSKPSSLTTISEGAHDSRNIQEVVQEIRDEFEIASSYGKEVALLLEVGKLPYQRRTTLLKVIFSRMLYLVSSHPPARLPVHISSETMKMAKAYSGEPGNEFDMVHRNLSSTLEKLYAWEKKLYKEVKDEERLRISYEKQCKRLKILDDRGAESSKIDATRASIRKLLTKIDVCVRAVDAISSKIHRLRDEELQPQISELIHGLRRMWKSMLRCHQKQFQAIMESKLRSLKANTASQSDSGLKATLELKMELINWCTRFNNWVNSQKLYVESLNEWLLRSILHESEETPDGPAPFSPGRMGAPPIFVICNDWCQAMVRISEKGVENAMLDFASSLHQLWEQQDEEKRQRIKAEYLRKDFEKQLRTLRMERGRIEQERDTLSDKTMSKVPSESGISPLDDLKVDLDSMRKKLEEERARHKEAAKLVHDAASSSLQAGLVPILEALGNFTSEVLKAHEQVRLEYSGGS